MSPKDTIISWISNNDPAGVEVYTIKMIKIFVNNNFYWCINNNSVCHSLYLACNKSALQPGFHNNEVSFFGTFPGQ